MSEAKIIQGRHGKFVAYQDDLFLGDAICNYGEYGEEEFQFLQGLLKPEDLVIEVGANAGYLTIPLAKHCRVIAIEPNPHAFELLHKNLELNSVNVTIYRAACGAEDGFCNFPDIGYDIACNHGALELGTGIKIPLFKLDSLVSEPVSLLKIDVEGMELDVLKGSRELIALYRPLIYVENDRPDKSEALISYLISLKYDCAFHTPRLFNPENYLKKPINIWREDYISENMICAPSEQGRIANKITDSKSRPGA